MGAAFKAFPCGEGGSAPALTEEVTKHLSVKKQNAVVSSAVRKKAKQINGIREQGRSLLEGRRDGAVKSEIAVSSPTADIAPPGMYPHPATLEKAATQQRLSDVSRPVEDTIGVPQGPVKRGTALTGGAC